MRHTLIELAYAGAGLLVALVMTWAAAWAYPLAANVIWVVGAAAMVAVVAINWSAVREAIARDRGARS
ncbi:MAG TPA: hypothetical protein VF637_17605 [Sphingomicrobium sp.]